MAEKRLTKGRDKKIAGVCSGIAEYAGIDPTIVRLVWAILVVCACTGIFAYIICMIVMPDPD